MAFLDSKEDTEDYLEVDAPVPGQSFCCLSFISPEKILEQKDRFLMKKFVKSIANESGEAVLQADEFESKFDDFVTVNETLLDEEFHKEVGFKTSVRGVKVRGVYSTYDEAAKRAAQLQRADRAFHVYVGQVGYWLPWDPTADNIADQQYLEKELNELMQNYKSNQVQRDLFYSSQVEESKRKAAEEQAAKKEEQLNTVDEGVEEVKDA